MTGSTTQVIVSGGDTTTVTAVPDIGYSFLQWDDGATTTSRFEENVLASATHTAEFLLDTFTLSYSAGAGGTLTGSTTQTVGYNLDGSSVQVAANNGYHFVDWSDGATSSVRLESNVMADFSVTANFALNPSSATIVLPGAIGHGMQDVDIAMNETRNIQLVTPGGTNVLAYINSQADFQAPESSRAWQAANHSFKVTALDLASDRITLTIFSESKIVNLAKGESREVDLDGDGRNDVRFIFADIYINRAEITVESLADEPMPLAGFKPVAIESKPVVSGKKTAAKIVSNSVAYNFNRDLKIGMRGRDVLALQQYLNNNGYAVIISGRDTKGKETDYFGKATQAALIRFQKDKGIKPALGYFGRITRKVVNK